MQIKAAGILPLPVRRRRGGGFTKTLLVMKLTILFFLTGLLQVSARTTAQTVTYSGRSVTLTTVFSAIKKQTGYLFFYRNEDLTTTSPVTVDLHNTPLAQALEQTLAGQPLSFSIQGNTIFITARQTVASAAPFPASTVPPGGIHGRITDSLGNPLAGASVEIKGSHRGTVTDAKGEFTLKEGAPGTLIEITFTGFARKEYKVTGNEGSMAFIKLSRSSDPLDQVQVVAYGSNTRRFSVGSVTTVTSAEIGQQPVTNPLLALEGRVAGLMVNQSGGAPGALAQVQIRGQNSLISGLGSVSVTGQNLSMLGASAQFDQPMFIIDGVPFATGNSNIALLNSYGGTNSRVTNSGLSAFNSLNPSDIESITVLKDADATSIYGSQGANGVIVVTTKRGRAGKTNFDVRVNTGPNKITKTYKMLNTQQYLAMRKEAVANDGVNLATVPSYNQYLFADLLFFDSTKYTNWEKRFFGGTANNTDAYASLSGGVGGSTFMLSGGYTKSNYNFPGSFADEKGTMHSSFHHNSINHKLNLDFGSDFGYDRNTSPASFSVGISNLMPPNLPELQDAKGNLIWTYKGVDISSYNPLGALRQPSSLQNYNLNTTFRVSYEIIRGLNASVNMGYNLVNTKQSLKVPTSSQPPSLASQAEFARSDYQTLNIEPQIDYKATIGRGVLSALLGGTYKKVMASATTELGTSYTNDALLNSIDGAASVTNYDGSQLYKYDGAFARLGYVYDQKYIISLTGRRDGSSNFGPGHQFGSFGSAGAGWIFSEEKGFKEWLPFISYAKISGNYGTTGSDGVQSYNFQDFWKLNTAVPTFQGVRGYTPVNLYNPDYSWATKKSLNLGIDLGFFHDRVLANATWYRNRTGNQLTNSNLPAQTGFANVVENMNATLQDKGWEITLNTVNIRTKSFQWTSTFNIFGNRNTLVAFPNLLHSAYNSVYAIGKSTSLQMGFKYAGINDSTGIFEFYNSKGVKTSTPIGSSALNGGDMSPIIDLQPKFSGGFGNTFTYKGFSLTAFFHFTKQEGRNWLYAIYSTTLPGMEYNLPTAALDHWRKRGDHAPMERLSTENGTIGSNAYRAASYFTSSTAAFSDASYIRLQTLALSYNLPTAWLKKAGMKNASIYVNAQNLFIITPYKIGDPEVPGDLYSFPLQRTVMGGISLGF